VIWRGYDLQADTPSCVELRPLEGIKAR
jgi:hypothetical protein